MKNIFFPVHIGLLLSTVILLPSCTQLDWLKNKLGLTKTTSATTTQASDGKVIATANGKPFMSAEEFETKYNGFIKNHPLGAMIAQMKGVKRKIFEGLLAQKLITDYVTEKGLDKTPEYLEQLEQMKQMLNVRAFEMQHPAKASDSELKKFYEENKDKIPEAVVSQGGVKATGVSFSKEADAKAFLEKAKGKGADLEKAAKDAGLGNKFQDFKVINRFSVGVDAALKDKILASNKVATVELIKAGDNTFWVVYVASKEEPKLRSFDELKPMLEQKLNAQKQEESNAKALEKLKAASNIVVDENYFAEDEDKGNQIELDAQEQLEQVMPSDVQEKVENTKQPASVKVA